MAIRAKTKRRLIILIIGVVVLVGGGLGFVYARKLQIHNKALNSRQIGLTLLEKGDHFMAMLRLRAYLNYKQDDAEVLYKFAQARENVEEPRGEHLVQAIDALERVRELQPDHPTADHEILDMYVKLSWVSETKELAEKLLQKNPDDPDAIKAMSISLDRMREFDKALPLAEKFNDLKPLDLQGHLLTLSVMRSLERPVDELLARAEKLHEAHHEDPRFELLLGVAHYVAQDREAAKKWCQLAASREETDLHLVEGLVKWLTGTGLLDEALHVLQREGAAQTPALRRELVRRLWQRRRFDEIVDRLEGVDHVDLRADNELLAFKALSLIHMKRDEEAAPITEALAAREKDEIATSWARMLKTVFARPRPDTGTIIEVCLQSLDEQPGNPYFHYFLGAAYASVADHDLAMKQFQASVKGAPSWAAPMIQWARTLLASGQPAFALSVADVARKRWTRNVEAAVVFAESWSTALEEDQTAGAEELLAFVEQIQKVVPGEPRTLPIRIMLLAQTGKTQEATDALRTLLDRDEAPSETTLISLARVSRRYKLGLEDECERRCSDAFGASPQLALEQAMREAVRGEPSKGLALLDEAISAQGGPPSRAWQLARTRYLDKTNDPGAKDAWEILVDKWQRDRQVLNLTLKARSPWTDTVFIDNVIKRLEELGAGDNPHVRMARARWWLVTDPSPRNANKAAELLNRVVSDVPNLLDARIMLANALHTQGNTTGAIEQLHMAVRITPRPERLLLEQARLMQSQGDFNRAAMVLEQLAGREGLSVEQRRQIAAMMAVQGNAADAIALLEQLHDGDEAPRDLLLANLYRQHKQNHKVEAICLKLLEEPGPAEIEFVADVYASSGRIEEARAVLERLDTLSIQTGIKELIRAGFLSRHGSIEEAASQYATAVAAAPDRPAVHAATISFLIRAGMAEQAAQAVREAAASVPEDKQIEFLHKHVGLIAIAQWNPDYQPLVLSLVIDAAHRQIAVEVLEMIREAKASGTPLQQLVHRIKQLTDNQPRHLPLQMLTARLYLILNQPNEAARYAIGAMETFPIAVEPAWMACESLAAAGRWSEVQVAAAEWKLRSTTIPLGADLMIAMAEIQLNDPAQAAERLKPYLVDAMQNPDQHTSVVLAYARALIKGGQAEEAYELLKPLLADSRKWRLNWTALAAFTNMQEKTSAHWLTTISGIIPQDSMDEWIVLAQAWHTLGGKTGKLQYFDATYETLEPLAARDDATSDVFLIMGMISDAKNELGSAERAYRRALQIRPDLALAQNNLAMVLDRMGQGAEEAIDLATAAVASHPNDANYRDTLAMLLSKAGQHEEALTHIDEALALEPSNDMWRINRAIILLAAGRIDEAKLELGVLGLQRQRMAPALVKELESLERMVAELEEAPPAAP